MPRDWWMNLLQQSILIVLGAAVGALTTWVAMKSARRHERVVAEQTMVAEERRTATGDARLAIQKLSEVCVDVKKVLFDDDLSGRISDHTRRVLLETYWNWTTALTLAAVASSRANQMESLTRIRE